MSKKRVCSIVDTINDLDYIAKNFNNIFGKKFDDIVAQLVVLIGKSTAYDTGLARDLIANILMDLGRPDLVKDLEYRVYEFWKTREQRELEGSNWDTDIKRNNSRSKYNITIEDDGFYQQQLGKVSDIHPREDANVIPFNVDFYTDKMETGAESSIEAVFEELREMIISYLEGRL